MMAREGAWCDIWSNQIWRFNLGMDTDMEFWGIGVNCLECRLYIM